MQVYRAEWRMPCAVKKMKGRISKEQMTEFVREVLLPLPARAAALRVCMAAAAVHAHGMPAEAHAGRQAAVGGRRGGAPPPRRRAVRCKGAWHAHA